jgi:hypothetical protein
MEQEIQNTLEELNSRLEGKQPYKLYMAKAEEIDFLEKNARYMTKEQFASLTNNVKKDGGLTSIPLCYKQENGRLLVLSGNHRIKAAIEAGSREFLVLLIDKPMSKQQLVAIQLSHNAIEGQDDEQILKELWQQIDELEASIYTGFSSELIAKLNSTDFITISEQRVLFKEINFLFLPEEIEDLKSICEGIIESAKGKEIFAGRITEYADILEGIIAVKQSQKVINTTLAFFAMARVVREYLEGKVENLQEIMEEGVADTVNFIVGGTRKRINKKTATALRKAIKEKTDTGLDFDAALLALSIVIPASSSVIPAQAGIQET